MTESVPERVARIRKEIHMVRAMYGVTQWEHDFLYNIRNATHLSDKQEEVLRKLEKKVFEEQNDDD